LDIRKVWDESLASYEYLERINDNEDIVYTETKMPLVFSDRSALQYRYFLDNKTNPDLVKKYNLPVQDN